MKKNGGFTLIELVIVLIVLGILAAIAIPTYMTTLEKARATEAINQTNEIKASQDARALSRGAYGASLTGLGYNADTWTPQALWNYRTDGTNIVATRVNGSQIGRTLILTLGAINADTNQPAAAMWATPNATTHSGQP